MRALVIAAMLTLSAAPFKAFAGDWTETIKVNGDLRYRHEMIDMEGKDARHRHRVRARLGVFGEVSPYTKVGIQLATGSDDPVSTNQTLGDAFSTKPIGIDLAYFQAQHHALSGLTVTGGKFNNPFFKPGGSELIWDSDWNPEGGVASFKRDIDNVSLTLIGAGLWINESSSDDSYMAAAQGVVRFRFDEKKSSLAVGGGYFNYANTEGFEAFYESDDPKGNSLAAVVDTLGNTTGYVYATDYDIFELLAEATTEINETPVTLMVDYVGNSAADSLDTGWLVGFMAGHAKDPGSWEFRYIYREVEKDAVVGAFTDSDFRGGGTDAKGHEIGGAVALAKGTAFGITCFINEIGLDADDPIGFNRLQVDLQLKF